MSVRTRALRTGAPLLVLLAAIAVASCSSSSTSTPTPVAPAPQSTTVAIPASGGSVTLAAVSGYAPAFQLGAGAPANTTLTATSSVTAPANAPAPSAHLRTIRSLANATPFFYLSFSVNQTTPTQVFNSESLTWSTPSSTLSYYVEIDDITSSPATKLGTNGPGTVSGTTLTISNAAGGGGNGGGIQNLVTGHTYLMMFYSLPAGSASPSPSPSSSSSASPSPSPSSSSSASPSPSPSPTSSGSNKQDYTFPNPQSTTFTPTGTNTISVPATSYGVAAQSSWGANNASGSFTFTAALASGNGDITPTTFPKYTASGHVVTYMKFTATPETTFNQTPNATFTVSGSATFGGTSCNLYTLNGGGGGSSYTWQQAVGPATPSGSSVNFPAQTLGGNNTVDVGNPSSQNGSAYLALICQ